jgi:hypothetical protein
MALFDPLKDAVMKRFSAILAASLAMIGAAEPSATMPAALAGDWVQNKGAIRTEEHWDVPQNGVMTGTSRRSEGNEKQWEEQMRIEAGADGRYTLSVSQSNEPAVSFAMVRRSSIEIIFANPAHDYPQRIRYWREGPVLKAQISLVDGSRPVDWVYQPKGK